MKTTYLIVPAVTDQAGQCRIMSRQTESNIFDALRDYRTNPSSWKEAGLMSSSGEVRCLNYTHPSHIQMMRADQPLMAGTAYTFED